MRPGVPPEKPGGTPELYLDAMGSVLPARVRLWATVLFLELLVVTLSSPWEGWASGCLRSSMQHTWNRSTLTPPGRRRSPGRDADAVLLPLRYVGLHEERCPAHATWLRQAGWAPGEGVIRKQDSPDLFLLAVHDPWSRFCVGLAADVPCPLVGGEGVLDEGPVQLLP